MGLLNRSKRNAPVASPQSGGVIYEAGKPPRTGHATSEIRLPVESGRIEQVMLDYAFSILINANPDTWTIRVEGEFSLQDADSGEIEFPSLSDAPPSSAAAAADALLHQEIVSATAGDGRPLIVELETGIKLVVPSHPAYEAWQATGPRDQLVVCAPDGGLVVWEASSD